MSRTTSTVSLAADSESFIPDPTSPLAKSKRPLPEQPVIPEIPLPQCPQGTSLAAIINANRVMTSDPSSILTDQGHETSEVIIQLAWDLIKNAREEGLEVRRSIFTGKKLSKGINDTSESSTVAEPSPTTEALSRALNFGTFSYGGDE
ncbi:hypothetical protein MPER_04045, partial [Moniliophthora perniciosa FA553]